MTLKAFGKGKQYQENAGPKIKIALYFSTATQLINDKKGKRKGKDGCKGGPIKQLCKTLVGMA